MIERWERSQANGWLETIVADAGLRVSTTCTGRLNRETIRQALPCDTKGFAYPLPRRRSEEAS